MSKEELNQELSADDLKDVSGGVVDFGGSQFKPMNTIDPFGDTDPPTGDDAQNVAEGSDGSY